MREEENPYENLVGKPEGKRLFGRPSCRWYAKIKIILLKIQDRMV
jgi:hypothetical protein